MKVSPVINFNTHFKPIAKLDKKNVVSIPIRDHACLMSVGTASAIAATTLVNKPEITEQTIIKKLENYGYEQNENGVYKLKNPPKELAKFYSDLHGQGSDIYLDNVTYMTKEHIAQLKDFLNINPKLGKKMFYEHFDNLMEVFNNLKFNNKLTFIKDEKNYKMVTNTILNMPDTETKFDLNNYKGKVYEQGIAKNVQNHLRNLPVDESVKPEAERFINKVSKYIDTQKIDDGTTLYRGERFYVLENVKLADGKTVNLAEMMKNAANSKNFEEIKKVENYIKDNGISATQPAFMSASLNDNNDFERKDWIYWTLTTDKNTKGVYLESLNTSFYTFQDEVLLQKGSNIAIQDAKYDSDKNIWYLTGKISN